MSKVAKKQSVTIEERRAKKARRVEEKIVAGCAAIRTAWVVLAGYLHEFQAEGMWTDLGYDSFEEWLASPDISLGRSHVYTLIEIHRELVLEREVDPEELAECDVSKVGQVLPAIRRESIDVDEALADARELSRSDLRERYRKKGAPGKKRRGSLELKKCDLCGKQVQVDEAEECEAEAHPDQLSIDSDG